MIRGLSLASERASQNRVTVLESTLNPAWPLMVTGELHLGGTEVNSDPRQCFEPCFCGVFDSNSVVYSF